MLFNSGSEIPQGKISTDGSVEIGLGETVSAVTGESIASTIGVLISVSLEGFNTGDDVDVVQSCVTTPGDNVTSKGVLTFTFVIGEDVSFSGSILKTKIKIIFRILVCKNLAHSKKSLNFSSYS